MHKVFISYHHANDQRYKEHLVEMGHRHRIFIDKSVDTGDIDEDFPDERIREIIRDRYLRDSTVTIVLIGQDTAKWKHVDWEIYSSMFDGQVNKKSGLLVISLPGTSDSWHVAHDGEKEQVYPDWQDWVRVDSRVSGPGFVQVRSVQTDAPQELVTAGARLLRSTRRPAGDESPWHVAGGCRSAWVGSFPN